MFGVGKSTVLKLLQQFSDDISGISYEYIKCLPTIAEIANVIANFTLYVIHVKTHIVVFYPLFFNPHFHERGPYIIACLLNNFNETFYLKLRGHTRVCYVATIQRKLALLY